jgi:hypothetical protein
MKDILSRSKPTPIYIKNKNRQLEELIKMGERGHFPLFDQKWIEETHRVQLKPKMRSLKRARHFVKETYDNISRHRGIEKQQVAFLGLPESTKYDFIFCFLTLVESRILDRSLPLH